VSGNVESKRTVEGAQGWLLRAHAPLRGGGREGVRTDRNDQVGISLIELIVVVVIFGILVAIAIPLFLSVQGEANINAVRAAAATGALQVAGDISHGTTPAAGSTLANLTTGAMIVTIDTAGAPTIDTLCVKATNGAATWFAGAGALPDGSGCS